MMVGTGFVRAGWLLVGALCVACGGRTDAPQATPVDAGAGPEAGLATLVAWTPGCGVGGMVVEEGSLYWTQPCEGTVLTMPAPGGAVTTLATGQSHPGRIATGGGEVYWENAVALTGDQVGNAVVTLMYLPSRGAAPITLVSGQSSDSVAHEVAASPDDLALTPSRVYWLTASNLVSMPRGGGTVATLASSSKAALGGLGGLALDDAYAYWSQGSASSESALVRAPLAGGALVTLATGHYAVGGGLAVSQGQLFCMDGALMRVPVAGGAVTTLTTPQDISPGAIAVDGTNVYWSLGGATTLLSVPVGGGPTTTLVSGQAPGGPIAVDGESLYWSNFRLDYPNGLVMRFTPK